MKAHRLPFDRRSGANCGRYQLIIDGREVEVRLGDGCYESADPFPGA